MSQNPQFLLDLVTFTEDILNGKLHLFVLCDQSSKTLSEFLQHQRFFFGFVEVHNSLKF